jgi:hypothetical protein
LVAKSSIQYCSNRPIPRDGPVDRECPTNHYCGRPEKNRFNTSVPLQCVAYSADIKLSYCGDRRKVPTETGSTFIPYVDRCEEGLICDQLPGHGSSTDVPSACLQAPAKVVEKSIGAYCGGAYCRSRCPSPPPCPVGLKCSPNLQVADAGSKCLQFEYWWIKW